MKVNFGNKAMNRSDATLAIHQKKIRYNIASSKGDKKT